MKKSGMCFIAAALYAGCVTAETVTNNLNLQGGFVYNHGIVNPGDVGLTFTNAGIRDITVSAGQLSGVDPATGAIITNSANLLALKAKSLVATSNIVAGGTFIGNGAGLTNLTATNLIGRIPAGILPTSGVWNASGLTVSNLTVGNLGTMAYAATSNYVSAAQFTAGTSNFVSKAGDVITGTLSMIVQGIEQPSLVLSGTDQQYKFIRWQDTTSGAAWDLSMNPINDNGGAFSIWHSPEGVNWTTPFRIDTNGVLYGNGAGLTGLHASSLSGSLNASSLPTSGVWNAAGMIISNVTYKGNGAGITNIPSSAVKNSSNKLGGIGCFALGGLGNTATGTFSVVAGGQNNYASTHSFVGGGMGNNISTNYSVIGGGYRNAVTGSYSTVAGGYWNTNNGVASAIGGGACNTARGQFSVIPGGALNEALGDYSLAAGRQAKALHNGVFIWGDSQTNDFASVTNDEFAVRAANGLRLAGGAFIGNGSGLYIPPQGDLSMGSFTNGLPQ